MSTSSNNIPPQDPNTPVTVVTTPAAIAGEDTAERFLLHEVRVARRNLRFTQIIGSLLAVGTIGYLSFVTANLNQAMQPDSAAEIATGIVKERVDTQGTELADQFKQRIPAMIAGVPDYAMKQMPVYRARLEDQIEADLTQHVAATSKDLDGHLDDFLNANKDDINAMLTDGQDPEKVHQLAGALHSELVDYMKESRAADGETLQQKVDQTLVSLDKVQARMDRLANAKDLTPQEKKARRAIAILAQNIDQKQAQNGSIKIGSNVGM